MEDQLSAAIEVGCDPWIVGLLAVCLVVSEYLGKSEKFDANGIIQGVFGIARKVFLKF